MWAAGESSFMGETLTRLGAGNIIPAQLGPFPKINPEYVVKANPGLIMVGTRGAEGLASRPGWDRIEAVKRGRMVNRAMGDPSEQLLERHDVKS